MSLIQIRPRGLAVAEWSKLTVCMSQSGAISDQGGRIRSERAKARGRRIAGMDQIVNPVDGMPSDAQAGMLAAAMLAMAAMPIRLEAADQPLEGGVDPAFGTVRWRTLFCGDRTQTGGVVMGIAEFAPGGTLLPHRHSPAEVYFGLDGAAVVTVDGVPNPMGPGTALYIPGDAEHGTVAGPDGFRMLYVFPRDRFSEVEYRFSPL
jgi:quercetin dioxygenase-like cupin family protein